MGDHVKLAGCWAAFLCRVSDAKDPLNEKNKVESMVHLAPKILEALTSSSPSTHVLQEEHSIMFEGQGIKLNPEEDLRYNAKDFLRHSPKVRAFVGWFLKEFPPDEDSEDFIKDLQKAMEEGEFTHNQSSFEETAQAGRLVEIKDFIIEQVLGIGGFGFVAKARCEKFTPKHVAIKFEVFDKKDLVKYFNRSLFATGDVHGSDNIIPILSYFSFDVAARDKIAMCMVMPLCSRTFGDVVTKLNDNYNYEAKKHGERFGTDDQQHGFALTVVRDLALPIVEGVAYMHGKGVVHRDLKPPNILIGPKKKDDMESPNDAIDMESPNDAIDMESPNDAIDMESPNDAIGPNEKPRHSDTGLARKKPDKKGAEMTQTAGTLR